MERVSSSIEGGIFLITKTCMHCGQKTALRVIGNINDFETVHYDGLGPIEEGDLYQILECSNCDGIIIRKTYFIEDRDVGRSEENINWEIIYPQSRSVKEDLPESVADEYTEAQKVKHVSPNAYGMLLGRALEAVCEEHNAEGDSLFEKVGFLAEESVLPEEISELAHRLRKLRNVGAHFDLGHLSDEEIEILERIIEAILAHLYSIPSLIEQADKRIEAVESE